MRCKFHNDADIFLYICLFFAHDILSIKTLMCKVALNQSYTRQVNKIYEFQLRLLCVKQQHHNSRIPSYWLTEKIDNETRRITIPC